MDPLSITASAIAVVTLAAQTCSTFASLRRECKSLPGRVHAINNEVSDTYATVSDVADLLKERDRLSMPLEAVYNCLPDVLDQLTLKLTEIQDAVEFLTKKFAATRLPLIRLHEWSRTQDHLQLLQHELKYQKGRLNVALGASNSCVTPLLPLLQLTLTTLDANAFFPPSVAICYAFVWMCKISIQTHSSTSSYRAIGTTTSLTL